MLENTMMVDWNSVLQENTKCQIMLYLKSLLKSSEQGNSLASLFVWVV